MTKSNYPHDVFKHINMMNGDAEKCWPWTGALAGRDQRPVFSLFNKSVFAYRVVWELVNGRKLEKGEVVRHKCDNKICCNPNHLEVGTQKENIHDTFKRDRGHAVLTRDQIRITLGWIEEGFYLEDIRKKWAEKGIEVSRTTLSRIKNGHTFKDIPRYHVTGKGKRDGTKEQDGVDDN